jgi:hypothetical protein
VERGAVLSVEQCWELAERWYEGTMNPEWKPRSNSEAGAIFREVGLTDTFWHLE